MYLLRNGGGFKARKKVNPQDVTKWIQKLRDAMAMEEGEKRQQVKTEVEEQVKPARKKLSKLQKKSQKKEEKKDNQRNAGSEGAKDSDALTGCGQSEGASL